MEIKMDPSIPYKAHQLRKSVLQYKVARKSIFQHMKAIMVNIGYMDKALMSIHKDLLNLHKPMFDRHGNILPDREMEVKKYNVFSKIFQTIRIHASNLVSSKRDD